MALALHKGNWELKRHAASRKSQALQTRIRRRHKSNPRDWQRRRRGECVLSSSFFSPSFSFSLFLFLSPFFSRLSSSSFLLILPLIFFPTFLFLFFPSSSLSLFPPLLLFLFPLSFSFPFFPLLYFSPPPLLLFLSPLSSCFNLPSPPPPFSSCAS